MPQKFILKEKIGDMINYGYSTVKKFSNKEKVLKDNLNQSMFDLLKIVIRIESGANKSKEIRIKYLDDLDVELDILRHLIRFSQDSRNFDNGKLPIPLSKKRYEHWAEMLTEIGKIIGGYKKALTLNNKLDIDNDGTQENNKPNNNELQLSEKELKLIKKAERQRNWKPKNKTNDNNVNYNMNVLDKLIAPKEMLNLKKKK